MENQSLQNISSNTNELSLLLSKLTESQVITNNAISTMDNRLKTVEEKMDKEVFVTNVQCIEIKRKVKSKVSQICIERNYDYKIASKILFYAIYSDINNQYCVTNYHELPRAYYKEIVDKIDIWSPTELIIKRIAA